MAGQNLSDGVGPISGGGRHPRSADIAVLGLILLGAVLAGVLALSAAQARLPCYPLVACETALATAVARVGAFGQMVPLAAVGVMVLATLLSLGHQLLATRRMLQRVLSATVPPTSRIERLAARAGLGGRIDTVGEAEAFTFCHGYFRPRVCLSTGLESLLDDEELTAVMQHEAHHVRMRDPLKMLLARAFAAGLFFLPLAGSLRDAYLGAKELCADDDACRLGSEVALARALVKLLKADRPRWPAGVLAVGSFTPTELRVKGMLGPRRDLVEMPRLLDWLLSLALAVCLVMLGYGARVALRSESVASSCPAGMVHQCPLLRPSAGCDTGGYGETLVQRGTECS